MKTTEGYILRNIGGEYYLLPIGQNIALRRGAPQLNHTGTLLWNSIQQGANKEYLLKLLMEHYEAGTEDIPILQSDIDTFISHMQSLGLLSCDVEAPRCNHYFKIGGIIIGYEGPDSLIHPNLLDFTCKSASAMQFWSVEAPTPYPLPMGEILIRTNEIEVCQSKDAYHITFFPASQLIRSQISLDGTYARFFCIPPFNSMLTEKLFHAFRFAFLIYAQRNGVFALHSSSILYRGKAWLFSAASGTGKSTHAELWRGLYETPLINGDLNLVSLQDSVPVVTGLPWCGTSGIYSVGSYPLGGITLLKQYSENSLLPLSKSLQQLMVTKRIISPSWTEEMMDYNLNFACNLVDCVTVYRYLCTKEPSAAAMMRQYIDHSLNE